MKASFSVHGFEVRRAKESRSARGRAAAHRNHILRWLLAVVVFSAAVLKTSDMASQPVAGDGLFSSRPVLSLVVLFELLLAIWLASGLLPRATWRFTLGWLTLLIAVSAHKAISGESSCGCFGGLQVSPWVTLALDLFLLAGFVVSPPSPEPAIGDESVNWVNRSTSGFRPRLTLVFVTWLMMGAVRS